MTLRHCCYDYSRDLPLFYDVKERVRGIEPPCAAWEAAVLPLNYTREEIFDFRFSIADCNRNKLSSATQLFTPNGCSVRCPQRISRDREDLVPLGTADATAGHT
jgi:hypothetical protein